MATTKAVRETKAEKRRRISNQAKLRREDKRKQAVEVSLLDVEHRVKSAIAEAKEGVRAIVAHVPEDQLEAIARRAEDAAALGVQAALVKRQDPGIRPAHRRVVVKVYDHDDTLLEENTKYLAPEDRMQLTVGGIGISSWLNSDEKGQ